MCRCVVSRRGLGRGGEVTCFCDEDEDEGEG